MCEECPWRTRKGTHVRKRKKRAFGFEADRMLSCAFAAQLKPLGEGPIPIGHMCSTFLIVRPFVVSLPMVSSTGFRPNLQ